jgi:hypothetical protein
MMVVMAVMAEALHLRKSYGNRPLRVNLRLILCDFIGPKHDQIPSPRVC